MSLESLSNVLVKKKIKHPSKLGENAIIYQREPPIYNSS